MKLISLIFIFGLITCLKTDLPKIEHDKVKEDLMNRFKNTLASAATPTGYSNLGALYYRGTEVTSDFLSTKNPNDKLKTYHFPKEIEGFILSGKYSKAQVNGIHSVSETLVEHFLVAVKKYENENGEFLYFVVIKGKTQVNKVQKYQTVPTEKCNKPVWCLGFCKKCHTVKNQVPIPHTGEEMATLMKAAHSLTDDRIRQRLVSGVDKIDKLPPTVIPVIKPINPVITVIPNYQPTIPEIKLPEIKLPEIKLPEVKLPEVKMPSIPVPEVKMPSIPVPDIKMPSIPVPEVKLPPVKVPDIKLPPVKVPDIKLPSIPKIPKFF